MGQISHQTTFFPGFAPGGLGAINANVSSKLFEDFESYANDAAVQAVWTETGGAGNPTLATGTNAVHGDQSIQTVVAGSVGTLNASINQNNFGFSTVGAGGRLRYVVFKGIVTTGSQVTRLRLSDASDANLYKEWEFTLGQDVLRDHIVDLYSDTDTGYRNAEGFPAPNAVGSTTWEPDLIDRIEFRNLAVGATYRFDDIRFYYEYSLMDALGFGTEAFTDDGVDGSIHSKLRYLNQNILQLVGTTEQYRTYGPPTAYLNYSYTFGLELIGTAEQGIPTTTEIVPGTYTIDRVRDGTTTSIVGSTAASEAAGFISAAYTPLEDNWQPGDSIVVTFTGGQVNNDTDTIVVTNNIATGQAVVTFPNIGDAAFFQVGQRVRVFDNDATEFNTVLTIDSPTQLTLGSNTSNLYDNSPQIVLSEQTLLQNARISTSVTYEPELAREIQRAVIADYDDFDTADADADTERWDTGYVADSDGGAAGSEGGTADINTTTAGQLRISVDPDATPTRAAYAVKRDDPSNSRYYTVSVDANVTLDNSQATSTYAGLRISAGDVDDPSNYILVARERRTGGVDRITAHAEFAGVVQTAANFSTTDNAVAFKIERYSNVWNVFYSLTQFPNWQWVKLVQFEDANGDMTSVTSMYMYAESGGSADAQTAVADFDNWRYYIGLGALDQILSTTVLGTGTFTTSSATVPADTGRAEADDYWNGVLLMPTTGAVAYQPRTVVDFANAGGVFTIDPETPFTAAPAVGDEYAILAYQYPLEPAADSTNNSASPHVVGNKADTIPAMNAAPGATDSLVRHAKAILERIGTTPADPDDSVLTNIGQRDDAATSDDLSDITTTSMQAKLRRILLRFSSDAFSATIQGSARTDVENMLNSLATYFSSAGAAWSVTANPGGTAKDNLEQTIEDLADMLAGTTGITTYPAAAPAANGVSMAEVLRQAAEGVGEDTANNTFASTNVVSNRDGSLLERTEFIIDAIEDITSTATHTVTAAHSTTEQTISTFTPNNVGHIAVQFDLNTLDVANEGGTITVRLYSMIDGSNLRIIDRSDYIEGTDEVHPTVIGYVHTTASSARITIQVNSAVTANRDVEYRIIES